MRFQNQVALITGGGNGMGRATALRFAKEGARVVVADIESENAARVADEIRAAGGDALDVPVDVSQRESVEAMVARCVEQYGRVDILCAIAGIAGAVPFLELTDAQWDRMLAVNLKGVFLCGQLAAQQSSRITTRQNLASSA
jgi:NAD(P)-dependent dehydrogenase (short-subunit alcohol dehydrogenase family)